MAHARSSINDVKLGNRNKAGNRGDWGKVSNLVFVNLT